MHHGCVVSLYEFGYYDQFKAQFDPRDITEQMTSQNQLAASLIAVEGLPSNPTNNKHNA